ncbi:Heme peroxidase [Mycena indigotica]|uniref:Heme peroxidase n=1 Tax=Mycena indigotica TaxID=2126181 RepID=A0A8H6W8L2_9AGAR|nr:Heme peroxidase [Mycena indigotica]KAF7309764.1 Heme peroxidase [Mycena indigotica]
MNRRSSFFFRRQPSTSSPAAATNGKEHAVTESPSNGSTRNHPPDTPTILQSLSEQASAKSVHTSALSAVVDAVSHRDEIDDRKLALEHGISFVSKVSNEKLATTLQNKIIELFYNDLAHPHATNIGNNFAWRTADGGNNNVNAPDMGRAGTPYARSVQQSHPLPRHELPDASLLFDALLKREGFVEHPAGLSSLMFSFAALVIHSVFRTSHTDVNINDTSSYVDLSPLYGVSQAEQDTVRKREAGLGLLYPDVFAEDRLLLLPPAVCVLLVLFSRNHNYIAQRLYEINERNSYRDPGTLNEKELAAQDEQLFQTARLVNCGWFGSVVFSDYFSSILGLVRQGSNWSLNPFGEFRDEAHSLFDRGQGNVCSVEFNCLYRWHATTSIEDEKWVNKVFNQIFEGKAPEEVTREDFKAAAIKVARQRPDVHHWTFGDIRRQEDGSFKDEDLSRILKNATDHPAAAFRARGTPASMRLHEIMGIEQNRQWGVCSLNDFRRYLGLKPYASFLEWNPNPEVADAAEKLYGNIEYLELYVGLQAEETKELGDGAGLCPGYTISRAILADAIALTRGYLFSPASRNASEIYTDRHFTYDYTPFNLTAWGFADCQRDPDAYGFGSTLGRLFQRTLPDGFTENSTYAFFPLMTPTAMKANLTKLHLLDGYDMARPKDERPVQIVSDYETVAEVLKNTKFVSTYATRSARFIKGKGFFIVESEEKRQEVFTKLFGSSDLLNKAATFFRETTSKLIASSSFKLVGGKTSVVDIVRDVLRLVPIYWAADISGVELKTKDNPHGDFTAVELYTMLSDIYSFVFLDSEKAKIKVVEAQVQSHVEKLLHHIGGTSRLSVVGSVATLFKNKKTEQHDIVKRLRDLGRPGAEVANMVLAIMVASVELSLSLTNLCNAYIGSEHQQKIQTSQDISGFIREALRVDPPFRGVYRTATSDVSAGGTSFPKDARLFLDVAAVYGDGGRYANPTAVDSDRKTESYLYADGAFKNLGDAFTVRVLSEVLKTVLSYKGITRAPGQSGSLKRFKDSSRRDLCFAYLDGSSKFSVPWPGSMTVQYEAS